MTNPSKCRFYFAGWCERNSNAKCICEISSDDRRYKQQLNVDCKYFQPKRHGGKKK